MLIRIGSRESALAVIQAENVAGKIKRFDETIDTEIITMKTSGDMIVDRPLESAGGKGLFVKELDRALFDGKIDTAVHSLKDIPSFLEKGLAIKSFLRRDDARDVLVLPEGVSEADMSKPIGCSGGRRRVQLQKIFPRWEVKLIRGNVLTRLRKLDSGEYGALALAAASLIRLKLAHRINRYFSIDEILPAAGQGIVAICAKDYADEFLQAVFSAIDNAESRAAALAERAFIRTLSGGCGSPAAAYSEISDSVMTLRGLYAEAGSPLFVTGSARGGAGECEELGRRLAIELLSDYYKKSGVKKGKVTLIGAGPGDPGLLGIKAKRALEEADVVLYDNLAGRGVIAQIPYTAKTIYVGKKAGAHTLRQDEINFLLVKEALSGKNTARLKGGDPFLFARGGEELELLYEAGIPFEVIPGVTSAVAVPAYGGIPVTHRGLCSQAHIIAAHRKDDGSVIDYESLVKTGGTLIFLMGVSELEAICDGLIKAGAPENTPAAIIEQGCSARQRKIVSTLSALRGEALKAGIRSPAITVAGEVCELSKRFSWFEKKPLFGLRIGVTRPASRAAKLSAMLAAEGAEVVEIPAIQIEVIEYTPELENAFYSLRGNEWFVFTSPAGVEVFFDKLIKYGKDVRALRDCRFAAIGKTTALELAKRGVIADIVPETYNGKSLGRLLAETITTEKNARPLVILPRSKIAGGDITDALSAAGIPFIDIPVYDTVPPPRRDDAYFIELITEGLDWLTFTSASTVSGFARIAGEEKMTALRRVRALCIGNQTAAAARQAGFDTVTAKNATLNDMLDCLLETVCAGR
ncbi:MAG: uroporphyrinogen-III C-methyltransferase [Spirochaetaceae bacterium]|jgi:uroporphyrinogen III methyltransferase/synthase|nr:uroporphyrinogen-III C-methyltransferase [Spirochaetaceae bacterium]